MRRRLRGLYFICVALFISVPGIQAGQSRWQEYMEQMRVLRQKGAFADAEKAGLAIKKSYPVVQVGVYDHVESVNKIIQLPES